MDSEDWEIAVPRTAAAWSTGETHEIERELENDLTPHLGDLAEGGCQSGGWPEDETVQVDPAVIVDGELSAHLTVYFTEVIPSSCKDMPYHEKRESRFRIVAKRSSGIGYLEYSVSDPTQWDLLDRNSAADGT